MPFSAALSQNVCSVSLEAYCGAERGSPGDCRLLLRSAVFLPPAVFCCAPAGVSSNYLEIQCPIGRRGRTLFLTKRATLLFSVVPVLLRRSLRYSGRMPGLLALSQAPAPIIRIPGAALGAVGKHSFRSLSRGYCSVSLEAYCGADCGTPGCLPFAAGLCGVPGACRFLLRSRRRQLQLFGNPALDWAPWPGAFFAQARGAIAHCCPSPIAGLRPPGGGTGSPALIGCAPSFAAVPAPCLGTHVSSQGLISIPALGLPAGARARPPWLGSI